MKRIQKKQWEKAEYQLKRSIRKDSVNALARYLLSVYFFDPRNPAYQPDSAYRHVAASLADFSASIQREKEKLERFPLDSAVIIGLRDKIDSAIFEVVKDVDSEQVYIGFLKAHPLAPQAAAARKMRDAAAYRQALSENSYKAFLYFLNKYPSAVQAPEARKRYERRLFEESTKDEKLSGYESFLRRYPETPFREEAERKIFELFTISGEVEKYLAFARRYPQSSQLKRALDILFHIINNDNEFPEMFLTDSLKNIRNLNQKYLVPFLRDGRFGFMDEDGTGIPGLASVQLADEYRCGNVMEDILILDKRLAGRDGHIIYRGKIEEIDDLGSGFLKLKTGSCFKIIHKTGIVMDDCAEDAEILSNRFLAVKKNQKWSILSFAGIELLPDTYDSIAMDGNVLALQKNAQWYLLTPNRFEAVAERRPVLLSDPYDDIKIFPDGLVWVKARSEEAIFDKDLFIIIPFKNQKLYREFFGFTGRSQNGYNLYDHRGKSPGLFEKVIIHSPWIVVNQNNAWSVLDSEMKKLRGGYDTIRFEGSFMIGNKSDTLTVHFGENYFAEFTAPLTARFIPGKDSTAFLMLQTDGIKTLYDKRGKKLFSGDFDSVESAGRGMFIVSKNGKKGLISAEGKLLLPTEFDAIGSASGNVVSLLKNMKFGLYHIDKQMFIQPQYDKNLVPYTEDMLMTYHDGAYGFINWNNQPVGAFEFAEIRYWNDTAAWVRKDDLWSLYDIAHKSILKSGIKEIRLIRDTPDEKLAIVQQEDAFGVLSNRQGTIIPLTFTDLVNVGSTEVPLYFTEKHIAEASIFVVIYYNKNGELIRKEVYEEPENYEKIYCSDP